MSLAVLCKCGQGTKGPSSSPLSYYSAKTQFSVISPVLTLANSLHPETGKKGTGWSELEITQKPNHLKILNSAKANFNYGSSLNFNGCGAANYFFSIYFRLAVSRDGGETYSNYDSRRYLYSNGGTGALFEVKDVELSKGDILDIKFYFAIEEESDIVGGNSNACMAATVFANGVLNIQIDERGQKAVEQPSTYQWDSTLGFEILSKQISIVKTGILIDRDPSLSWLAKESETYALYELPSVRANQPTLIQLTFVGSGSWEGCSYNINTRLPPSFYIRVEYSINGNAGSTYDIIEMNQARQFDVNFKFRIRLKAGQTLVMNPNYRLSLAGSPPLADDCVTKLNIGGRILVENYPYVE